ncbi:MAG: Flp pilus assembly protein CpaB [Actinomycetota bacterium]
MKSRSLIVALAVLLAVGATAAVFLYVNNVREDARTGGELTPVIVSTVDIAAGTQLDELISADGFVQQDVPTDAVVSGAVTSLDELQGRTAEQAILANEQIALGRLSDTGSDVPGGTLGLREDYQALSVKLTPEQFVGRALRGGDRVSFYAFLGGLALADLSLEDLARGKAPGESGGGSIEPATVMVVPDARVLAVTQAPTETDPAAADEGDVQEEQIVTLELTPEDAMRLITSQNTGSVWLGLIRPGDEVTKVKPVGIAQVVGR